MNDFYDKRAAALRHDFRDHVATRQARFDEEGQKVADLVCWRRPDTASDPWFMAIDYRIEGRRLVVGGDTGYAVYVWSSPITLSFLAGCGLDYFASKCLASEHGAGFKAWDPDAFVADALAYAEWLEEDHEGDDSAPADRARQRAARARAAAADRPGWQSEWVATLYDSGHEWFGDDLAEGPSTWGEVIHLRCQGHLVGLQMAAELLGDIDDEPQHAAAEATT